jgi:chromosome segregation ATPase
MAERTPPAAPLPRRTRPSPGQPGGPRKVTAGVSRARPVITETDAEKAARWQAEVEEVRKQFAAKDSQIAGLTRELEASRAENDEYVRMHERQSAEIRKMKDSLKSAAKDRDEHGAARVALAGQVSSLTSDLKAETAQVRDLRKKLTEAERARDSWRRTAKDSEETAGRHLAQAAHAEEAAAKLAECVLTAKAALDAHKDELPRRGRARKAWAREEFTLRGRFDAYSHASRVVQRELEA